MKLIKFFEEKLNKKIQILFLKTLFTYKGKLEFSTTRNQALSPRSVLSPMNHQSAACCFEVLIYASGFSQI